jgi:hypothetical protein
MYLVLRTTSAVQDGALSACAVLTLTPEVLARFDTHLALAAQVSAMQGHAVTLSWDDPSIAVFDAPPVWDECSEDDYDLSGQALFTTTPFPPTEHEAGAYGAAQPMELLCCEIQVSTQGLYWRFFVNDKYSSEEETGFLGLAGLADLRQALTTLEKETL